MGMRKGKNLTECIEMDRGEATNWADGKLKYAGKPNICWDTTNCALGN